MKRIHKFILFCLILNICLLAASVGAASVIEDIWKEKVQSGQALLAQSPDDVSLRFTLAVAYANLGELIEASRELEALEKLDGGKLAKKVISECQRIREERPEDLVNLNYLAFAYFALYQYANSRAIFGEILALDPESVWSLNYYAIVLGNLEEYESALHMLERANSIQENKYTHFIYSLVYFKQGKMVKSMWHLSKSGNVGLQLLKK